MSPAVAIVSFTAGQLIVFEGRTSGSLTVVVGGILARSVSVNFNITPASNNMFLEAREFNF